MKHLGVKVKEPRNLEPKRGRMGSFLPKIKVLLLPSQTSHSHIGRAVELHKQRPQKQSSQAPFNIPEHSEPGRGRPSLSSEGSEPAHTPCVITSPPPSAPDPDTGQSPSSAPPRPGEALLSGDSVDLMSRTPTNFFEFPSSPLEHLPEEDHESDRMDTLGFIEVQSEDDQSYELEADPPNWQQLVSRDVLAGLTPHEIKRQECSVPHRPVRAVSLNDLSVQCPTSTCPCSVPQRPVSAVSHIDLSVQCPSTTCQCSVPHRPVRAVSLNDLSVQCPTSTCPCSVPQRPVSAVSHIDLSVQCPSTTCQCSVPHRPVRAVSLNDLSVQCPTSTCPCSVPQRPVSAVSHIDLSVQCPSTTCQCSVPHRPVRAVSLNDLSVQCPTSTCPCSVPQRPVSAVSHIDLSVQCPSTTCQCSVPHRPVRAVSLNDLFYNRAGGGNPKKERNLSDRPDRRRPAVMEDAEEKEKVKRAGECCRQILNYVNQAVKESENKQRLEDYQRRLDLSSLKQSEYPMIEEFRNLDLTKRKMIHEGPLTWKVNKDKTIELYTLLLEDILVLLQKQDDRLILKCHSKNLAGTAETKHVFSPVIKLNSVLVRQVATDNKAFFVLSMSDNGAHIYELVAQTVSEQKTWQYVITQRAGSIKTKPLSVIALPQPAPPINDGDREEEEEVSTTANQKLSKESERISTGSIQSPEKDVDITSPVALQTTPLSPAPFEVLKPGDGGEGASFPESVLDERPPFMQQRSRQAIAMDDEELVAFDFPPSPYRAEEALKNLMALKQVLLSHLLLEEEGSEEAHFRHRSSAESSRAVSQRGSLDSSVARAHKLRTDRASTASEPASLRTPENSPEREAALVNSEGAKVRGEEAAPGEQMAEQFFESAEGYEESYLILEGYGGVGESSTDEDFLGVAGELNRRRGSAGDSAIDLKKLLSSSSSSSSRRVSSNTTPELSRQVMAHMGLLQANLHHLKEVETRYNILCQRLAGSASDTEENKGNVLFKLHMKHHNEVLILRGV
ncbi:UNVERIFIED_CONTAM: hypothetical protein FKN15_011073 [Acipenser sinensis]